MPKLTDRKEVSPVKMLVVGDSGTGKTGALESLVRAGYSLNIIDFDNGLDYLTNALMDSPELLDKIQYATFTNKFKTVAGKVIPKGQPAAWPNALKLLETGKVSEDEKWGVPTEWDEKTFLVVDSLTMAAKAAFWQVLQLNNRMMEQPHQSDWGQAQGLIEGLIQWLCSEDINCNVMFLTHVNYLELTDGLVKGYPSTIGKALSATLPRYFNTILNATSKGSGKSLQRVISPVPVNNIETKASVPVDKLPASWPLQTAYAEFMYLAKGSVPNADWKPGATAPAKPGLTFKK